MCSAEVVAAQERDRQADKAVRKELQEHGHAVPLLLAGYKRR